MKSWKRFKNARELASCLRFWQSALSRRDWNIFVRFVDPNKFDSRDSVAESLISLESKTCEIEISRPSKHPDGPDEMDQEADLVHELLHTHFAVASPKSMGAARNTPQETSINEIADALVRLRRESEKNGRRVKKNS